MKKATSIPHNHTFLQSSWAEDAEWWQGAAEEDSLTAASGGTGASPPFGGGGLLSAFLPPPPRPSFLEIPSSSSCDLCGWAWQEGERDEGDLLLILNDESAVHKSTENIFEDAPHEFGLVLALIIVSIVSAIIGAIVMVSVIQCRNRLKNIRSQGVCSLCRTVMESTVEGPGTSTGSTEVQADEANKGYSSANAVSFLGQPQSHSPVAVASTGHSMWAWLTARRSALHGNDHSTHVERHHHCTPENHYTLSSTARVPHVPSSGASNLVEEALYAELDQRDEDAENGNKDVQYEDPSYQNMGYQNSEVETEEGCRLSASSPPLSSSSAYYSDLSTSANIMSPGWEATYEVVDTHRNPAGDACSTVNEDCENEVAVVHSMAHDATMCVGEEATVQPRSLPLTKTVPSDYV